MRKANFFILLLLLVSLSSCDFFKSNKISVPVSQGKINEVSVIIDDYLWNGEVGDSLRSKLARPIDGLVNEEPSLTLNQFSPSIINDQVNLQRNLVIIEQSISSTNFTNQKDAAEYKHIENFNARPQNVFYIKGNSLKEILELISKHGESLESSIKFYELLKIQEDISLNPLNDSRIKNQFQISLTIPYSYKYTVLNPNFLWLKNDISTGSNSLLIYQVPISRIENNFDMVDNFVQVRDSVTQKYIKGVRPNSSMVVDKSYAPYFKKVFFNENIDCYEFRGSWDLTNDFMEGPYITYIYKDIKKNRYLFLDGFVYNPTQTKRDLMFELEAIIKNVYFY